LNLIRWMFVGGGVLPDFEHQVLASLFGSLAAPSFNSRVCVADDGDGHEYHQAGE
jgi:hypothetical protein